MSVQRKKPNKLRHALVTGAIVAGASLAAAGIVSAATGTTGSTGTTGTSATSGSSSGSSTTTPDNNGTPDTPPSGSAADPATLTHGPGETLLTGTDLQKATAAATAAVPGATIVRAETNSSGDYPYEVHMKKSDGSYVTVELDSNFSVITTISGFGAGPAGSQAPSGAPGKSSSGAPSGPSGSSSTPTA